MKLSPIVAVFLLSCYLFACRTPEQQKHVYMKRTFRAIDRALNDAEVTHLDDSVKVIFPCNVMFAFNSVAIDGKSDRSLNRFAKVLRKFDKTQILISGFTDNVGGEEYNNELSTKRADTVKAALVRKSVAPRRIESWGMGMRHPIADNSSEDGRARNRRVEFVVLYEVADKPQ